MKEYLSKEIKDGLNEYWDLVNNPQAMDEALKAAFRKWTVGEKRKKAKRLKKAHRGTNYASKKAKKGYTKTLAPGGKTYIYKRQSAKQRYTKKKVGQKLGRQQKRLRS